MNCIIIEDQPPAQRILWRYIKEIGTLDLQCTFSDAIEAQNFLKSSTTDLIFLDVHLPKLSGMDFLKALDKRASVILTTAFSDYAVESYDYNVVDYLVKPFSFERFEKAVLKVPPAELGPASETVTNTDLIIKSGHEYSRIAPNDVLYIQSGMDYTDIVLEKQRILSSETLLHWENTLDSNTFLRVHKSYIVNLNHILKYKGSEIYLANDVRVPLGRAYKRIFVDRFIR